MSDCEHELTVFTGPGEDYVGCFKCGYKLSCHDHIAHLQAKVEKLEADVASWKRLESEAAEVRDMACGQVKALEEKLLLTESRRKDWQGAAEMWKRRALLPHTEGEKDES